MPSNQKPKKLPSVTIAVCAYNEASNITAFLDSVVRQAADGFQLKKIIVISDGSADATVRLARRFADQGVTVIAFWKRIGKSSRLNYLYRSLTTDFLVQSDADVVFAHDRVVHDLLQPLIRDRNVGMTGGHPVPVAGQTFTGRAVNATCAAYSSLRPLVRGGNNILSADGRLLAYRKKLVKSIVVPGDMIANDAFTYFCCLSMGWQYRYVASARVLFRSPQSLQDQIRQNTRFVAAPARMQQYFPVELVQAEYTFPSGVYWAQVFQQFVAHPILCTYIYIINQYCKFRSRRIQRRLTATWAMAESTKQI